MRAKLGIIQQNYNVIEKIDLKVWAKSSQHRTMQKTTSGKKILVSIQLLGGIVVVREKNPTSVKLLSSKTSLMTKIEIQVRQIT